MTFEEFEKLIDKNKSQVFVFTSKANFPFLFALHTWVVTNVQGEVKRWEILFTKNKSKDSWGHLYLNHLPPFKGIEIIPFIPIYGNAKLIGKLEGDKAKEFAGLMETSNKNYPYTKKYFLLGPNSNTYTQWALNQFPNINIQLPWNAFGKNFR